MPVTATFGLLGVFVCFAIGYDLGKRLKQEAVVSASMATVIFLMIQLELEDQTLEMENLGVEGIVHRHPDRADHRPVQKLFTDRNLVIKLPDNVPPVVYESFLSLSPLFFLVVVFWLIRFVLGVDINHLVQTAFRPLVFALNTLPGILVYAFLVTLLWSVGINGDNAMDAIVAPIFLQFLAANVEAMTPRPAVALHHRLRILHRLRQRRRDRGDHRPGAGHVELEGARLPQGQPPLAADPDFSDQRTDLLRFPDCAESDLHGAVHPQRADPDDRHLSAHALGIINKPFVNVPWTTPPDHRPLPGLRRRLARGRLGCGIHRDCHGGLLSRLPRSPNGSG